MLTFDQIESILATEYEKLEAEFMKKETAMLKDARAQAHKGDLKDRVQLKLKKHYIIRESDIKKLSLDIRKKYTITSKTLTKDYFTRRSTFFYLKNKKYLGDQYSHSDYPKELLARLTNIPLWSRNYLDWLIRYDEAGELAVRAGLRQPESKLVLAKFVENG
jgi:hypothetical protein